MLKDRVIIVFGDDWGRYPSTLQHIMKELIKTNKLVWIGSLGMRKPKLNINDLKRVFEKIKNIFVKKTVIKTDENITILHPFILPFHNLSIIRFLNKKTLVEKINNAVNKYNLGKPIFVTSQPIVGDVLGEINESSSHYFCLDDYTQFEGAYKIIEDLEKDLLKKIDTCFAVSETLLRTRIPATGHNYFLPQGVNVNHFNYFEKNKTETPVIGFFGLLSEWIDLDLIVSSAKTYPDYKFLIIGKYSTDISCLSGIKNLEYIGEVSYNQLPEKASKFDVGIIPFVVNELTIACNPLKLLEYMSLGIPVVSTNLPEVAKFKDSVLIANSKEEFIKLIPEAVKDSYSEKNKLRRITAEKFSWQSIAENFSNIVNDVEKKQKTNKKL